MTTASQSLRFRLLARLEKRLSRGAARIVADGENRIVTGLSVFRRAASFTHLLGGGGCPGWDRTNAPFSGGLRRGNLFRDRQNRRRTMARTGTLKPHQNHSRVAEIVSGISRGIAGDDGECQQATLTTRNEPVKPPRAAP